MKLTRSLLLGTAAGFAAVAGAQAADLPVRKAAPVEYVRVCSLGGGAFVGYVIPGSDICLRVGGFARYQYTWNPPSNSLLSVLPGGLAAPGIYGARGYNQRFSGQSATGALILDARTQTEYGLARAFIDMRVGEGFNESGAYIDKAWLQLGGFQAGKYQSYFDFYADAFNNIGQLGSDHSAIGAAYTAIFGNFSAAISLEDYVGTDGVASSTFGAPAYYGIPGTGFGTIGGVVPGGYRVPDVIARLLYADAWGQVQLSGALHQVRATTFGLDDGTGLFTVQDDNTKYGWAVQGGVKVNTPMFGPSDALYLQAAYTEGALLYIGANGTRGFGQSSQLTYGSDAIATGDSGSLKLTKGWNALAAFSHTWTPTFSTAIWGGYTSVDYTGGYITGTVDGATGIGLAGRDFHYWQAGLQANWSPIRNLTVAGTVNYVNTQAKRLAYDPIAVGTDTYFRRSTDGVQFAVRVQRDF